MPPLAGRKLWFVGIGGAGLSAYAQLARAWGAEVGGWDRVETPYLAPLRDVEVRISPEPEAPERWEVVVSTAYTGRIDGKPRAELLAELVSLRRSIVVAGAHGKTTTTAMIAFCLDRLGLDPAFLVGGEVPQLGGNAGAGEGWLVVEGDESDRSVAALRPEIAVLLNVDLDHHATFGSVTEVQALFDDWLARVPHVVRAESLEPVDLPLAIPGAHNRRNAAAALAALELAGVARADAERAIVEFRGAGRRLEARGEARGIEVLDSYAHHPAEIAADIAAVRERFDGRVLVLFQPHLFSRTQHLAHEFAVALATADAVCVCDVYPAREEPIEGVSGRLIVDALADRRPGMRLGWAPAVEAGAQLLAGWARSGDVLLTLGAGDVDRAVPLLLEAVGVKVEEGVELSRFTTLGSGGPARAFARPRSLTELEQALAWAGERRLAVTTIGLGSNLLAADEGVDALVLRLEGELAAAEARGDVLVAGGGAPNAVSLHRARAAELGGFEFACAIPGTAGGGVWMNAGAYGSDWATIMTRALVVTTDGSGWLTPSELGMSYRHSGLRHGQVVARVEFGLRARPLAEIKTTVADLQAQRKAAQPTNKRTFGSVFKNPEHELSAGRMLEACGLKGHRIGGAQISPKHANFIENAGAARSADAIALMAEARRRANEQFGVALEHEVELLGELELPPV